MKKNIEWSSDDASNNNTPNPWERSRKPAYEDLILKEDLQDRRLRFNPGLTWMRILPAHVTSPYGWMMGVHALNFRTGQFAHPRTLKANAKSVFDHAYRWVKEHHPQALYSKVNKAGIRLLTDPVSVFWALVEENGKFVPKIFQGSGYSGDRGGAPGLGFRILSLTRELDEEGNLAAEPVHPERGVLVGVEKVESPGAYPSYALRLGRQPAPMDEVIGKVEPEDLAVLCPVEDVIRTVTEEEEWSFLSHVMAPEHVAALRQSLKA